MRKTILLTSALTLIGITQASYMIHIPMEQGLSEGSIKFTNRTLPVEPLLGEWVDKGLPINCSEWAPLPSTVKKDETFEQSSTCSQEQTRTNENKSEESQTITVIKKQSATGTKIVVKQCVYGATWGAGYWTERKNNTVNGVWYGPTPAANEYVIIELEGKPTSYTQDGYTYSKGEPSNIADYYYICRE